MKNPKVSSITIVLLWGVLLFAGCTRRDAAVPRPEGYCRIDRVDTIYTPRVVEGLSFDLPLSALVAVNDKPGWFNIEYPYYRATLWCSSVALTKENRERQLANSRELVYIHAPKASAITAQSYVDEEARKYATLYRLAGDVATPLQFEITDSVSYLFRGALYFDTAVVADSVAPVVEYITDDVCRLVESLKPNSRGGI